MQGKGSMVLFVGKDFGGHFYTGVPGTQCSGTPKHKTERKRSQEEERKKDAGQRVHGAFRGRKFLRAFLHRGARHSVHRQTETQT